MSSPTKAKPKEKEVVTSAKGTVVVRRPSVGSPTPPPPPSANHGPGAKNVQVVCRFRPRKGDEPNDPVEWYSLGEGQENSISVRNIGRDLDFGFDRVHGEASSQAEVFDDVKHVVEGVLEGYNGSLMAYGQTSSGKTHTMLGKIKDPMQCGVMPRALDLIFEAMNKADSDCQFNVKASYVELYCERIQDLLDPAKVDLKISETADTGVKITDVTQVPVTSRSDVLQLLKVGQANRSVSGTKMNAQSSRSHVILEVIVTQLNFRTMIMRKGKLVLVDLAGSERVGKTGVTGGVRLEEAKKINKSLTFLGLVIKALADNASHVPYRDSKLTRLLQESLGGNSRTALIICCAPELRHAPETVSTLRFGERARQIKIKSFIKTDLGINELRLLLSRAQHEIEELRAMLRAYQSAGNMLPLPPSQLISPVASPVPHVDDGEDGTTAEEDFALEEERERQAIESALTKSLAKSGRVIDFEEWPTGDEAHEEEEDDDDDDDIKPGELAVFVPQQRPDAVLNDLQDEITRITGMLSDREKDYGILVSEVERLQDLLAEKEESFAEQVVEAANAKGEITKLESQLKSKVGELAQVSAEAARRQAELESEMQQLKFRHVTELSEASAQLAQDSAEATRRLEKEMQQIKSQHATELSEASAKLAKLEQAISTMQEEEKERVKKYAGEIAEAEATKRKLEASEALLKEAEQKALNDLMASQAQVQQLESLLSDKDRASVDASIEAAKRYAEVEDEVLQLKTQIAQFMEEKAHQLAIAAEALKAKEEELHQAKLQHENEQMETKAQLAKVEQALSSMKEEEEERTKKHAMEMAEAAAVKQKLETTEDYLKAAEQKALDYVKASDDQIRQLEVLLSEKERSSKDTFAELTKRCTDLEAELSQAKTEAARLEKEKKKETAQAAEVLKAKEQELQQAKADANVWLAKMEHDLQSIKAKEVAMEAKQAQDLEEANALRQKLQATIDELEQLKDAQQQTLDDLTASKTQVQNLEAMLADNDKSAADALMYAARRQAELETEVTIIKTEFAQLTEDRAREVAEAAAAFEAARQDHAMQLAKVEQELQTVKVEETSIAVKHALEVESLTTALRQKEQDLTSSHETVQHLQTSLQKSQAENARMSQLINQELEDLRTQLVAAGEKLSGTSKQHAKEMEAMKSKLTAKQQALEVTELVLHEVQATLADVTKAKDKAQAERNAALEQLASVSESADNTNGQTASLKEALERREVELARAVAEQDRLKEAVLKAQEDLHEFKIKRDFANEAKLDAKQRALEASENRLKEARSTLAEVQKIMAASTEADQASQGEILSLRALLKEKQENIDRLENELKNKQPAGVGRQASFA